MLVVAVRRVCRGGRPARWTGHVMVRWRGLAKASTREEDEASEDRAGMRIAA
jgi:hypothetical protein